MYAKIQAYSVTFLSFNPLTATGIYISLQIIPACITEMVNFDERKAIVDNRPVFSSLVTCAYLYYYFRILITHYVNSGDNGLNKWTIYATLAIKNDACKHR